jgi:predicted  nucleic acid-binding Zn-ribbon protein
MSATRKPVVVESPVEAARGALAAARRRIADLELQVRDAGADRASAEEARAVLVGRAAAGEPPPAAELARISAAMAEADERRALYSTALTAAQEAAKRAERVLARELQGEIGGRLAQAAAAAEDARRRRDQAEEDRRRFSARADYLRQARQGGSASVDELEAVLAKVGAMR